LDAIAAEDFIPKNFSEVRWARNMALLNMSLMDAGIVCWEAKFFISIQANAIGSKDQDIDRCS
jgi:hypothetical protein